MSYDEVMLIRCRPDPAGQARVLGQLRTRRNGRVLMFFHGPGLDWALNDATQKALTGAPQRATLMLCSAGWRRRHAGEPPPGWQVGSLVQFWDAADRADRVVSFGARGD